MTIAARRGARSRCLVAAIHRWFSAARCCLCPSLAAALSLALVFVGARSRAALRLERGGGFDTRSTRASWSLRPTKFHNARVSAAWSRSSAANTLAFTRGAERGTRLGFPYLRASACADHGVEVTFAVRMSPTSAIHRVNEARNRAAKDRRGREGGRVGRSPARTTRASDAQAAEARREAAVRCALSRRPRVQRARGLEWRSAGAAQRAMQDARGTLDRPALARGLGAHARRSQRVAHRARIQAAPLARERTDPSPATEATRGEAVTDDERIEELEAKLRALDEREAAERSQELATN